MAIERTYNVPLRREWLKAPKYRRAERAVIALKRFLIKHMKSENISLGQHLNELIWQHGMRNPPHHIKINVLKEDDGKVLAELVGFDVKKKEEKKEDKESKKEAKESESKIKEEFKKLEQKTEKIKKEKEAEGKKEEKEIEHLEAGKEKAEKKKEGKPREEARAGRGVTFEEKRKKEKAAHH